MSILTPLDNTRLTAALLEVELRLDAFATESAQRAERHGPHYRLLWEGIRTGLAGGKRIRPRLLLQAHAELSAVDDDSAIRLATAIELLHTALLLHDDVIDRDIERRGRANLIGSFAADAVAAGRDSNVATHWGETAGILAGDLLLTEALRMGMLPGLDPGRAERISALMGESLYRAAAGELADVAASSGLATPSVAEIRRTMADKTAHYSLELPLRSAAVLAGAARSIEEGLGRIGRSLGMLFQMTDDLLGVFGDHANTGKSTSCDLREGKETLLIAFARMDPRWEEHSAGFGDPRLDERGAARLRELLTTSGARERFEGAIGHEHAHVHALIREAGLPESLAAMLRGAADEARERRA